MEGDVSIADSVSWDHVQVYPLDLVVNVCYVALEHHGTHLALVSSILLCNVCGGDLTSLLYTDKWPILGWESGNSSLDGDSITW